MDIDIDRYIYIFYCILFFQNQLKIQQLLLVTLPVPSVTPSTPRAILPLKNVNASPVMSWTPETFLAVSIVLSHRCFVLSLAFLTVVSELSLKSFCSPATSNGPTYLDWVLYGLIRLWWLFLRVRGAREIVPHSFPTCTIFLSSLSSSED